MGGRRPRVVALVAAPRSGTHFLQSLLSDHPDVRFYSEVMHDRAKDPAACDPDRPLAFFFQWLRAEHGHTHLSGSARKDAWWALQYLAALRAGHTERVVGIDLKYWTWSSLPPLLTRTLESGVDGWIHLVRLDLLRAVVSDTLRQLHRDQPGLPPGARIRLPDAEEVLAAACQRGASVAAFRKHLAPKGAVEVVYEHLFEDPRVGGPVVLPAQQARLLAALRLPAPGRPLRSGRTRDNPPDLSDVVENWEAVRAAVAPRLAAWLTDHGLHDLAAYSVGP